MSVAVKGAAVERATGVCATPSTVNVTVPVGAVVRVFGVTVAVKVTFSLIAREVPGAAVSVVLVPVACTRAAKRRRQVVGVDRSESRRLVIAGTGRITNHGVGAGRAIGRTGSAGHLVVPGRDVVKGRSIGGRVRGQLVKGRIDVPQAAAGPSFCSMIASRPGKRRGRKRSSASRGQVVGIRVASICITENWSPGSWRHSCLRFGMGLYLRAVEIRVVVRGRIQRDIRHIAMAIGRNTGHSGLPRRLWPQRAHAAAPGGKTPFDWAMANVVSFHAISGI